MTEPIFLTLDEVVEIHQDQINRYGGSPGIRDIRLLQSALAMPAASFGGQFLHQNLVEMAGAYLFHLVQDHPFIDGNKRTGAAATVVFLLINGLAFSAPEDDFEELVRAVASGKKGKAQAIEFIQKYTR